MEKYAVDIDKVLDDFEQSEALENNQSPLHLTDINDFDGSNNVKKTQCNQSEQDSLCNQPYLYHQNLPTTFDDSSGKSASTSCIRTTDLFQSISDNNPVILHYNMYADPFQASTEMSPEILSSSKLDTPNQISNLDRTAVSSGNYDILSSDAMPVHDFINERLTTSVHRTVSNSDDMQSSITQLVSISLHSPQHIEKDLPQLDKVNALAYNKCSDLSVMEPVNQLSLNSHRTHFIASSVCDSSINLPAVLSDTSCISSTIHDKASNDDEVKMKKVSVECDDGQQVNLFTTKAFEFPVGISGASMHMPENLNSKIVTNEECNISHNVNVVGFSNDIAESELSHEEMNDYLSDLCNDHVQDEDSGVSSQEEINGNNLNIEFYSKEGETENMLSKNMENNTDSSSYTDTHQDVHCASSDLKVIANVDKDNSTNFVDSTKLENECSLPMNASSEQCETTALEHHNSSVDILTDAVLCEEFNLTASMTDNSVEIDSSLNSAIDKRNLKNLNESPILSEADECKNFSSQAIPHAIEDESSTQQETTQMKLVFSPNDGTFRSVPTTEITTSGNDSSSGFHTPSSNLNKHCENTLTVSPNESYSSRLQRPTTLNLPCRSVATANIVTSYIDLPSPLPSDSTAEVHTSHVVLDAADNETIENDIPSAKLGTMKPFWIPDSDASNCMHCGIKFTVIKRRHHCRACGKVLCSRCCNQKARLPYLSNKEDRVCQQCVEYLAFNETEREKEEESEKGDSPIPSSCGSSPSFSPTLVNSNIPQRGSWRPHPNNPDDYCSTISPLQQVHDLANRPPPTVMVPVGVLKRGNKPRGEPKQVIFSDGIRPGGDLTDLTESVSIIPPSRRQGRRRVDKCFLSDESSQLSLSDTLKKRGHSHKIRHKRVVVSDSDGPLPPILLPLDSESECSFDLATLLSKLQDSNSGPVVFAVTKNMHVWAKITNLDCCFGKECWCFTSHGLCTVGQDEVLLVLERFQDEANLPRDVFKIFSKIYDDASKGLTVGELGHLIFPDGIFGSWEHRGFLFVRPTFQCLSKLVLPSTPYLFAILIQKWEVPWAKVFPLRLMLRLGAECRYYPCSLVSIRFRKPVYFEIGQTIMSLLADLRNFQFTIPFVPGLVVHMEEKRTYVNIPKNRYDKLMKVLNSNNVEHVLALGCNFSTEADSHLVCMQRDEGDYQAQAINIEHTTRKVTGASFIVFSEALKSTTGLSAKFKIVEDGLLVEIPQETMVSLHSALRDMQDMTIPCGQINAPDPEEVVTVQWTMDDKKFNIGVISPVDKRSLEGMSSLRIHTSTDYAGDNYLIRWTEVFFLETDRNANRRVDAIDPCRLAETVAQAFCMAVIPYLDPLAEAKMTKIGLRITLDAKKDMVEYDVGALGQNLPAMYMNALDSSLIPVLSRITFANEEEPIALELIFYILTK